MSIRDLFRKKVVNKLDERIVAMQDEVKRKIEKAISENRFSFFEYSEISNTLERVARLNDYEKYKYLFDVAENWDNVSNFSRETGNYINELYSDNDNVIAIHRTNFGLIKYEDGKPSNKIVDDILTEGLVNNGHSMQGVYEDMPSLSLTTTPLVGISGLINLVASYKGNNGIVLLRFPKEYVDSELSFKTKDIANDIYHKDESINYIKPSYILGIILKDNDGQFNYYERDELLKSNNKTM